MKTKDEIQQHIVGVIEEITLGQKLAKQIQGDDHIITDLGLDSLDYATILLDCEKWLGIHVHEEGTDWSQIRTVSELAIFLNDQKS